MWPASSNRFFHSSHTRSPASRVFPWLSAQAAQSAILQFSKGANWNGSFSVTGGKLLLMNGALRMPIPPILSTTVTAKTTNDLKYLWGNVNGVTGDRVTGMLTPGKIIQSYRFPTTGAAIHAKNNATAIVWARFVVKPVFSWVASRATCCI